MATAKKAAAKKAASKKTAEKQELVSNNLPALPGMDEFEGSGLENADRDSFAIPFLAIMQKGSPQVDKDSDECVEDAEVGDLMLTTSQEIFKDEDGVDVVFCGYHRVFLRWAPRDSGGGFKGQLSVEEVAAMRAAGETAEEDGKLFADNGDILRDTRVHYVMVVRPDGSFTQAVLSMASTQIKKSKMLLTQIKSFTATSASGKPFNPPSFGHIFHAETVAESNDKGNWRGWKFTRKGFVENPELWDACVEFYKIVNEGKANVNYAEAEGAAASSSSNDDDDEI